MRDKDIMNALFYDLKEKPSKYDKNKPVKKLKEKRLDNKELETIKRNLEYIIA